MNQEDSEHNEVGEMKKGADSKGELSRLEQKWFISVRGESDKNAIEVSRCCGLRAQPGSRYLQ